MYLTEQLKVGRRRLDSLLDVVLLEDWNYDEVSSLWCLKIQIANAIEHQYIPVKSEWYITAENKYPDGVIKIYPSVNNSISVTFPHQANNGLISKNQLWRLGALCLDLVTPYHTEKNWIEPNNADERLKWHVQRALEWIKAASNGTLQSTEDYFELPQFNSNSSEIFAFSEDIVTYLEWESVESVYGYASINKSKLGSIVYLAKDFYNELKMPISTTYSEYSVFWGNYLSEKGHINQLAIWIRLNRPPVIKNWQAPNTLSELVEALNDQNIDLLRVIRALVHNIRDGQRHLLLLGFPIPERVRGENQILFWQALLLPLLSFGKKCANGFRNNEIGYWQRDRNEVFQEGMVLDWKESQNWNQHEITSRGKMDRIILQQRILIIGAGCIGSTLAELLVRAGVCNLTIMDKDILEIGNMSRHVLSIDDVGGVKENALAKRLSRINPNAKVIPLSERLKTSLQVQGLVKKFTTIIDCSGSDDVMNLFSNIKLKEKSFFISVSIGTYAKQLYLFLARNNIGDMSGFKKLLKKHIKPDEIIETDFPRDGIGCWHPKFPARSDDIWLASSTALKVIEKFASHNKLNELSIVFEQKYTNGIFSGYSIKKKVPK